MNNIKGKIGQNLISYQLLTGSISVEAKKHQEVGVKQTFAKGIDTENNMNLIPVYPSTAFNEDLSGIFPKDCTPRVSNDIPQRVFSPEDGPGSGQGNFLAQSIMVPAGYRPGVLPLGRLRGYRTRSIERDVRCLNARK